MKNLIQKSVGLLCITFFTFSILCCSISTSHVHTYSEEWTSDETYHWHKATCEHTDEIIEQSEHTFDDWTTTKDATTEKEGSKERSCKVCSYKETAVIEKLAKSEETDKKEKEQEKEKKHTHTFSETWTSDKTNHWHKATCEHTDEISGKTEHTYGEWTVTKAATDDVDGSKERTCKVCSYKDTAVIPKHNGKAGVTVSGDSNTYEEPQD